MQKIKIASISKLKPGKSVGVTNLGKKYAVFNIDGQLYGIDGDCKHMKASLAGNKTDGPIVTCAMHGWKFDVTNGACLNESWASLKSFPVLIEDDIVYLLINR